MTAIYGSALKAGIKQGSTWGTAVQAGAGDQFRGSIDDKENVQELRPLRIGSGVENDETAIRAGIKPTIDFSGDCYYGGTFALLMAAFLGTSGSPGTEITSGQGDYQHDMTYNGTTAAKFLTLGFEDTVTTSREYPSMVVQSVNITVDQIPGIVKYQATCLADTLVTSTSVNTNANLASVTMAETELVACAPEDSFYINVQSDGTLGSTSTYGTSDRVAITSFNLQMSRPMEIVGEIRNVAGNGVPVRAGMGIEGTLTVALRNQVDHLWWTTWSAETQLKAALTIQGSRIGTGAYKTFQLDMSGLQLVQEPSHPISGQGNLPLTLTFRVTAPTSTPTGMASRYPKVKLINTKSSAYLS